MSRDFPDWVDVERAARARRRFRGRARLAWLERVLDQLDAPGAEEEIGFELNAFVDDRGQPMIDVHVSGDVPMRCQRTLVRYRQPIDGRSRIAVVATEQAIDGLPGEIEPKLVPGGRLRLLELVEDELLLALPLVPRDPASRPVTVTAGEWAADAPDEHPFAALAGLKGAPGQDEDSD
ncbi:MAG: YceD family protein [Wenzhouxiangellaceae bacterium]|nr:YceD family protein [Wenzhouxiangellaceae bacterium]